MTEHIEALKNSISRISLERRYSLKEIANEELIPGNTSYSKIYSLAHTKKPYKKNKMGFEFVPSEETTETTIKAEAVEKPWATQISGKLYVEGTELVKFLQLNVDRLEAKERELAQV